LNDKTKGVNVDTFYELTFNVELVDPCWTTSIIK